MKFRATLLSALALAGLTAVHAAASGLELGSPRLQQVAITTTDLPRAVAFYRDTLGLRLMFESNGMAFFDLSGTRLMVASDKKRIVSDRPSSIIYIDAPHFEQAVAQMRILGIKLEGGVETVQTTSAGALKLQQFFDPDGNALAVMGLVPRVTTGNP